MATYTHGERLILALMRERERWWITREIVGATGAPLYQVRKKLRKLVADGLVDCRTVESSGNDANTYRWMQLEAGGPVPQEEGDGN